MNATNGIPSEIAREQARLCAVIEAASKAVLTRWYCSLRAGRWPGDLPFPKPGRWERMCHEERRTLPQVITVKQVATKRVAAMDLACAYHVYGFGGREMSVREFARWWDEEGGHFEWRGW